MSTGLIIALIVIVVAAVVVAAVPGLRARGPQRGRSLKRRFGPEYELAVARHNGDAKAAERELGELVQRHGSLHERPLEPERRQEYKERWAEAQAHFVESPEESLREADRLLAELAVERGFPEGGRREEQLEALSVHHPRHVDGYRRVHRASAESNGADTEEMRAAIVEARGLFKELVGFESSREPALHKGS
ncbi:hypothetical protein [Streptomyces sp. NPDC000983]|uniref:hypothetical protein n=1 Tax=Streptomyces sp. NPDC000983 TaxID=3154373 RepID=UPI0033189D32